MTFGVCYRCRICDRYGCPHPSTAFATWRREDADPPNLTGGPRWDWLHGPPAGWWATAWNQGAA